MERLAVRIARSIVSSLAALALAACAVGRPAPEPTLYALDIPAPPAKIMRHTETLSMGRIRVASAFAGRSLVFRVDDVRYTTDFYSSFIADPGEHLASRIAAWLDQAGPYRSVNQPDSYGASTHVLEAAVTDLYGDIRPGRPPQAVITIQFRLIDLTGVTPRATLELTLGQRTDLAEASSAGLVRAYGEAMSRILRELRAALARAP